MIEKYAVNVTYGDYHGEEVNYDSWEEAEKARDELMRDLEGTPIPIFIKINDRYIRRSAIYSVSVERRCFFEESDTITVPQTTLDMFTTVMEAEKDE